MSGFRSLVSGAAFLIPRRWRRTRCGRSRSTTWGLPIVRSHVGSVCCLVQAHAPPAGLGARPSMGGPSWKDEANRGGLAHGEHGRPNFGVSSIGLNSVVKTLLPLTWNRILSSDGVRQLGLGDPEYGLLRQHDPSEAHALWWHHPVNSISNQYAY